MVILALVFATEGCAVFVRDNDHHYRHRYRHWRSSVEQSNQAMAQLANQNAEDSGHVRQ
jgi:hypothetical protein